MDKELDQMCMNELARNCEACAGKGCKGANCQVLGELETTLKGLKVMEALSL